MFSSIHLQIVIVLIVISTASFADQVPVTSVQKLNDTFLELFSTPRHDLEEKWDFQQKILGKFQNFGLDAFYHKFVPRRGQIGGLTTGINVVGIKRRNNSDESPEEVLIFAAHYDTHGKKRNLEGQLGCPGVVDNGSGSTGIFEIARLLAEHDCQLNKTIYFVFMDLEEYGAIGSDYFVADFLIPQLILKEKAKIIGAYVLDMVLVYDEEPGSQNITQEMIDLLPEWTNEIKRRNYRGDFLAVKGRRNHDDFLFDMLNKSWTIDSNEGSKFKLYKLDPIMPKYFESENCSYKFEGVYSNPFMRSDHRNFWYGHRFANGNPKITIPSVQLSDMGNYRKSYEKCYHGRCDDKNYLTEKNLKFMKHTVDALIRTVIEIGEGNCNF